MLERALIVAAAIATVGVSDVTGRPGRAIGTRRGGLAEDRQPSLRDPLPAGERARTRARDSPAPGSYDRVSQRLNFVLETRVPLVL